jgi:dihydrofolate reductase
MNCLIMGRKSFEKWPYTGKPVQVLSQTLKSLPVAVSGLAELAPKLTPHELLNYWKGLGWQRIYLDGGEAARSFLECGLVKQLTLTRIPIILGTGKPLFGNTLPEIILNHLHTKSFASGLVQSDYEVI